MTTIALAFFNDYNQPKTIYCSLHSKVRKTPSIPSVKKFELIYGRITLQTL